MNGTRIFRDVASNLLRWDRFYFQDENMFSDYIVLDSPDHNLEGLDSYVFYFLYKAIVKEPSTKLILGVYAVPSTWFKGEGEDFPHLLNLVIDPDEIVLIESKKTFDSWVPELQEILDQVSEKYLNLYGLSEAEKIDPVLRKLVSDELDITLKTKDLYKMARDMVKTEKNAYLDTIKYMEKHDIFEISNDPDIPFNLEDFFEEFNKQLEDYEEEDEEDE